MIRVGGRWAMTSGGQNKLSDYKGQIKINLVNIESKLKKERRKCGLKVLDVGQDEPTESDENERKKYNGWIIPSDTTEEEMKQKTINMTNYPKKELGTDTGNAIYEIQYNAAKTEYQRRKNVQTLRTAIGGIGAGIGAGVATAVLAPAVVAAAPIAAPAAAVLASVAGAATGEKLGAYQHVNFKDELDEVLHPRRRFRRKPQRRTTDWVDTGPVLEPGPERYQGPDSEPVSEPEPEPVSKLESNTGKTYSQSLKETIPHGLGLNTSTEVTNRGDPEPEMRVTDIEGVEGDTFPVQPASAVLARPMQANWTTTSTPTTITGHRDPNSRWEP